MDEYQEAGIILNLLRGMPLYAVFFWLTYVCIVMIVLTPGPMLRALFGMFLSSLHGTAADDIGALEAESRQRCVLTVATFYG